ncbi:MAG: hypothetical protein Alpg2KO_30560 [Alphaproteobacteria bacterium]
MRTGSGKRGASLLSYGLIVGLISVVALVAVQGTGSSTNQLFGDVSDTLAGVSGQGGASGGGASSPTPAPITLTGDGVSTPFAYSDGSFAQSCTEYLTPASGYPAASVDGLYDLDSGGGQFTTRCDMTGDDGGWTLASDCGLPSGSCSTDVRGASAFGPVITANLTSLEFRIELDTTSRTYKQYLQNTGPRTVALDGVSTNHNGNPAYVASCKTSYGGSYSGRDWGLDEDLQNTWVGTHAAAHNQGSGNWRYNVMSACHRTLRADDGSQYIAQANTYFGGSWNSYCGGMYVRVNNLYAAGCAISHGYSNSGPEGVNSGGSYYDYVNTQQRARIWVR